MGIDYGRGLTNIDHETGIRYGVLPMHKVCQVWCDESEGVYPDPETDDCDCPQCGHNDNESHNWGDDCICDECGEHFEIQSDMLEPIAHTYSADGYECQQSGDDCDIFILKSPYYTLCQFCSPCSPGAGYILNNHELDCKAYCFGHDWFEYGRAPYTLYRVSDNSIVDPGDIAEKYLD